MRCAKIRHIRTKKIKMITKIFETQDTDFYSRWHLEDGGIVCLVVPNVGEIRMSLAKAEDIAESIARQAEYGRWAASRLNDKDFVGG